jgi:tetratricopeptide (TPR) repeat protein
MNQARFQRVKDLFQRALTWPPEERERRVTEESGGDDVLRAEVLDLLAHASAAEPGFLSATVLSSAAPATPPTSVPGFRILERLASGGSGTVWRAEQESPRREVALKILRLDALAPEQVARFEREAAILAGLDHPGIARVIQAGVVADGALRLPWIALEFVHGETLDEHVREHRPDLPALLALFTAVCDAVEHAHARGIVHRDLKPSNVMVDAAGRPRVLDFGVARANEGALARPAEAGGATRTGMLIGTLAYMAPEQARGEREIGPSADVYGLGALLFELLTGLPPIPVDDLELYAAVHAVCELDPPPLARLCPDLPRDLGTILAKTLEKEPTRRYASAGALAEDLRRLLGDRPVLARPATAIYQARKFVRRNRAVTLATLAVVLALAAGLGAALVNLRRARQTTALATDAATLVGDLMLDLAPRVGFGPEERAHVEKSLELFERLHDAGQDSRELQALRARLLYELAGLAQAKRDVPAMRARLGAALTLREALAAADPRDLESRTHLSQVYAKLGEAAREAGELKERDAWFERALALDQELVRAFPGDPELVEDLCWSLERLAMAAGQRDDQAEAGRLHLEHLARAEELVRTDLEPWKVQYNLSHALYFASGVRLKAGEHDLAAEHALRCVEAAARTVELEPSRRDFVLWLVDACANLPDVLRAAGRAEAARPMIELGLSHGETLTLADPQPRHLDTFRHVSTVAGAFLQEANDRVGLLALEQRLHGLLTRLPRTADADLVAALRSLAASLAVDRDRAPATR